MTETTNQMNGQYPADPPAVSVPFGSISLAHAEHILHGMFALEPDYFMSLLAEAQTGRALDLGAVAKARKNAAAKSADSPQE